MPAGWIGSAFGKPERRSSYEIDLDAAFAGYSAFERKDYISRELKKFVFGASSLGGARPKAAVTLENRHWLAKFSKSDDTYDAIRVEADVMTLATEAGFHVPEIRIEKRGNTPVFMIERFDRLLSEESDVIEKIPFMSATSATGHTELDARYGSYEEIAEACRRFGGTVQADLIELFRLAAFNVLKGNDDDHLRNHGFIYDRTKGAWCLSPLYDVAPRPQTSSTRKLAIYMKNDDDRASDLSRVLSAALVFGIKPDQALKLCEDLRQFVAANWERHMEAVGLAMDEIELVAPCFAQANISIMDAELPSP